MNDPVLKPKDVISIYKNTNSQFVDVYGCINKPKHLTYKSNMTLFDLMPEIQFLESYTDNNVAEENFSKIRIQMSLIKVQLKKIKHNY